MCVTPAQRLTRSHFSYREKIRSDSSSVMQGTIKRPSSPAPGSHFRNSRLIGAPPTNTLGLTGAWVTIQVWRQEELLSDPVKSFVPQTFPSENELEHFGGDLNCN